MGDGTVTATSFPDYVGTAYAPAVRRRDQIEMVWIVMVREIRDTLRDWRLVVPITLLTLVFPLILNFAASFAMGYFRRYGAAPMGTQAIPFMLLVVGFFPISFSLVIALETFVGEKERKSLEPLLATPLSNTQLYLGKTLSALVPPVVASYLGIGVYMLSLYLAVDYRPPAILLIQITLLTTAEALVMVSAAVVISTQTTSVRAANLLASFIILPMAFLVQGEAIILFWSRYEMLWYVLLALIVIDVILVRMGIRVFNREELLGREIDTINLRRGWQLFKGYLLLPPAAGAPTGVAEEGRATGLRAWLGRTYRRDLRQLIGRERAALGSVLLALAAAVVLGWLFAVRYPAPPGLINLEQITQETFEQFDGSRLLPSLTFEGILSHNVRSLLLAGLLAALSFGSLGIVMLMAPVAIIGFGAAQVAMAGYSPLLFIAAFILPHGIFELPAAILATAGAVRLGISIVSPPPRMTVSQHWLHALADFCKLFLLVVLPLLALAAVIEVYLTPALVAAVY